METKIKIEKVAPRTMFMHEEILTGSVEIEGKPVKFKVDRALPGGTLIVQIGEFEDQQRYKLGMEALLTAVITLHFEEGGKDVVV